MFNISALHGVAASITLPRSNHGQSTGAEKAGSNHGQPDSLTVLDEFQAIMVDKAALPAPAADTRAHILQGARNLSVHQVPLEPFSPMHVQVHIRSVGLSSSDLIYYETHSHNGRPLKAPLIIGKEATGEITALGAMAAKTWPHLRIGSRIAIEPSIPCRICHECASGKYNVCVNMRSAANAAREPYVHGFLRQFVNWPGEMVHPLPTNIPFDLATLAEPLARVIHAAQRAKLQPSTSVAVLGSGLLSLLTCAYAKSLGCYPICIIDTDKTRMEVALSQDWASHKYTVPPPPVNASNASIFIARKAVAHTILRDKQMVSGYETVFETTGSETGTQLAIFLAKRAGTIALMNGTDRSSRFIPLGEAIIREIDLISCHGYSAGEFPKALSFLASGSLGDLSTLITQKVPFEKAEDGFHWLSRNRDTQNKPVIRVIVGPAEPLN